MDYFLQNVDITRTKFSRQKFIANNVKGKKVLHVGFVDWPITNSKKNNLHLAIAPICEKLDGIDINITPELKKILSVPNGNIYSSWTDIKDEYDIIIVPEVIEHVGNLEDFLTILNGFSCQIIITAPDAYSLNKNFKEDTASFVERVHPDHNYWFSPYTLKNVITKYMPNKVLSNMYWIKGSVAAVID